jgi:hypothetical protein
MSVFRDSLVFFDQIGLYDVVLPFLLVFTLVFGIMEKSKILGVENGGSRKNLNAMVAFVTGFFVVASAQLVALINSFVAYTALVLVILVMMMLLMASMHKEQTTGFEVNAKLRAWLYGAVIIAVILIFMNGVGWLGPAWAYVSGNWNSELMGTVLLFAIVAGFIAWITHSPDGEKKKDE